MSEQTLEINMKFDEPKTIEINASFEMILEFLKKKIHNPIEILSATPQKRKAMQEQDWHIDSVLIELEKHKHELISDCSLVIDAKKFKFEDGKKELTTEVEFKNETRPYTFKL